MQFIIRHNINGKPCTSRGVSTVWGEACANRYWKQCTAVLAILYMKFTPIAIPNNEAQFLETRKFQIEEIARMYRVPLHMIGDLDHATFSNVEHLSLDFVKYSLDPWIVRWEQSLQKALLSDSEKGQYFVKFNVDGLLRGDYASRMQGYATARQNGWMSANDIRELEDMNILSEEEGGNLYLVNGSFTKLADAGAFANQNQEKEEETECKKFWNFIEKMKIHRKQSFCLTVLSLKIPGGEMRSHLPCSVMNFQK